MTPVQQSALAVLDRIAAAKFDRHLTQEQARAILDMLAAYRTLAGRAA